MIEILTAAAVFGFSLGFSQEMAKDLRRMLRRHRRPSRMGPPMGSYGSRLDEGLVQRGNSNGGPTTPKPDIIPKPQPLHGRVVDAYGRTVGYIPRPQGHTPNPPPTDP